MQAILSGGGSFYTGQADTSRIQLGLSQVVDYISRKEDAQAIDELEQMISRGAGVVPGAGLNRPGAGVPRPVQR